MSARESLDAMRAIEQAATEGPWVWEEPSEEEWPSHDESLVTASGADVLYGWGYDASGIEGRSEDRVFITAARSFVPKALAALDAVLALIRARTRTPAEDGSVDEYDYVGELADDILAAIEQALS